MGRFKKPICIRFGQPIYNREALWLCRLNLYAAIHRQAPHGENLVGQKRSVTLNLLDSSISSFQCQHTKVD